MGVGALPVPIVSLPGDHGPRHAPAAGRSGGSASRIERPGRDMFRNEFARGGPVVSGAIGALERPPWNLVGKALHRPVCDLLGGHVDDGDPPTHASARYGRGSRPGRWRTWRTT